MLLLSILVFHFPWQRLTDLRSTIKLPDSGTCKCSDKNRRKGRQNNHSSSPLQFHSPCPNPFLPAQKQAQIHTPQQARATFLLSVVTSASSWAHLFEDSFTLALELLQLPSPAHHLKQTRLHKTAEMDKKYTRGTVNCFYEVLYRLRRKRSVTKWKGNQLGKVKSTLTTWLTAQKAFVEIFWHATAGNAQVEIIKTNDGWIPFNCLIFRARVLRMLADCHTVMA